MGEEEQLVRATPCIAHKKAVVTVNFNQPRPFVSLLDVLSSLLTDGVFQIVSKDHPEFNSTSSTTLSIDSGSQSDFSGLYAEFIDKSSCCVVVIKLAGEVVCNPDPDIKLTKEDMQFSVHIQTMLNHLKTINPSFCLQMYRRQDTSGVHFKAFCKSMGYRQFRHIRLDTQDKVADKFSITDIDYDYIVVFELAEFRRIIRLAKSVGSNKIKLLIMNPRETPDGVHRSFLLIQVFSDNSYDEEVFCSSTEVVKENTEGDEEQPKDCKASTRLVIKNSEILEMQDADDPKNYHVKDLDEKYSGVFPVDYLNMFIKSLDRHTINLHITKDKPMIVTCSLGDESSFVAFVLAQQVNDDDVAQSSQIEAFACD